MNQDAESCRVPPYDEGAEKGLLGSILLDAERVLPTCEEYKITTESFYILAHQPIFDAASALYRKGKPVDLLTMCELLRRLGLLEKMGGGVTLDKLVEATPTAVHAEYYAGIVQCKARLRGIIQQCHDTEAECFTEEHTPDEILGAHNAGLAVIEEAHTVQEVEWAEKVKKEMANIETVKERRKFSGIETGFLNLDHVIQGLRPAEVTILAARPSMGKTSLAMNIVENVSMHRDAPRPVGVFSLEMSDHQIINRMIGSQSDTDMHKVNGGYGAQQRWGNMVEAAGRISQARIFCDDTGGLDVEWLCMRARRMSMRRKIELLVIDYLQLLHSHETARQGKQVETAHISGRLKALAKELNIPVLVLSQVSRLQDQRDKLGILRLSDLRDSGAIEQDADVVWLLRRPCKYPEDKEAGDETLALVDIAKHRNGPIGLARLNFEAEYTRFTDRSMNVDGEEARPKTAQEEMGIT